MGGTWPKRVEDEVASVEFELRSDDCCDDEEKWALDIGGWVGREKEVRRLVGRTD